MYWWVREGDVFREDFCCFLVLLNGLMRVKKKECFFPMQLSRKCSCATLLIKTHCTSWNGAEWKSWMKLFTSLNTFAVPIQAQHLTKAVCQVNIVGETLSGRCAFLCFLLDQLQWLMTIEPGARISTELTKQLRARQSKEETHADYHTDRQCQDSEEPPA